MAHRILSAVRRVPTLVGMEPNADREPEAPLGARDLIRECQEMLRGERIAFTRREDYVRRRLAYWRARAERPADDEIAA